MAVVSIKANDPMEEAIKLAEKTSAKTMNVEKKLADVIGFYDKLIELADSEAGDDRTGRFAKGALQARAIQEKFKSALAMVKTGHCDASILQCELLGVPMTRGGER